MSPDNDKALCEAAPQLYADRGASAAETCMCWGFSFGDGWFPLLLDLSKALEAEISKEPMAERVFCRASQVKEKFGTLRFYMTCSPPEMERLIDEAEMVSAKTCEHCGAPGKLRHGGWVLTLCDKCDKARK